ncbi:hypothetical protein C1645_838831 [Glomus cerebriforme]|uniref:Uncharacterized protein n=1 Tax=Glomus cerebriforme TaxID=658196 RepID=A0A397S1R7_9GLOM|nr:hypothetical protein C1645_838831 [Glomus cerebriforme]
MAKFYEKNGNCMEETNSVQVDPNDEVTWISYKIKAEATNVPKFQTTNGEMLNYVKFKLNYC